MKTYSLPTGTIQNTNERILNGLLPDRVVLGILDSASVHGSYTTNPFNFKPEDLTQIQVTVNGEKTTQQTIELDTTASKYIEAYNSIFYGMGCSHREPTIAIRKDEWLNGKCIYVFDLRHTLNDEAFDLPRHGNVSIHLKFKNAITKSLTVLVYAEYVSIMKIFNDRTIQFQDFVKDGI